MKKIFTVLLCLSLSCLMLLSACGGSGKTADGNNDFQTGETTHGSKDPQTGETTQGSKDPQTGENADGSGDRQEESGDRGSNDTPDDETKEPHYEMLSSLYPWIASLREEKILKIRTEKAAIDVAPGHFRTIAYSTDRGDIKNVYEQILLSSVKESPESEKEGGGYVQYDIYTKDGTFTLTFSNETVSVNGVPYHFEGKLYQLSAASTQCMAFITYPDMTDLWDTFSVFINGSEGVKLGEFKGLGDFEFTEYTGECDMNAKLRLVSDTVNLKILSEEFFMIEDDQTLRVFQLTGEKNFSEFFELASETV